jgi:hypothetical protein
MAKMTLKQRFNATPLIKVRLIALLIVLAAITINFIVFLAQLNHEIKVTSDFYNSIYLSAMSVLPVLFFIDRHISRAWIKREALIVTVLSKDFSKAFINGGSSTIQKQGMMAPIGMYTFLMLVANGYMISDGNQFMWIPQILIAGSFLYYIYTNNEKRRSATINTVFISEFGMLFMDNIVMWNDTLYTICYIVELKVVDDLSEGCNMHLIVDFYGMTGSRYVEYFISIPKLKTNEINDAIQRIMLVNQRNKEIVSQKRR